MVRNKQNAEEPLTETEEWDWKEAGRKGNIKVICVDQSPFDNSHSE